MGTREREAAAGQQHSDGSTATSVVTRARLAGGSADVVLAARVAPTDPGKALRNGNGVPIDSLGNFLKRATSTAPPARHAAMKITNSAVPVYTISGSEARPLPEWLIRRRKRSLKNDPEFANRVELLQDFGFEEASQCVRVSDDGDWVMSTGTYKASSCAPANQTCD